VRAYFGVAATSGQTGAGKYAPQLVTRTRFWCNISSGGGHLRSTSHLQKFCIWDRHFK